METPVQEHRQRKKVLTRKLLLRIAAAVGAWYARKTLLKQPCRTSIRSGHMLVNELLDGHAGRFFENARMGKAVFGRICDMLAENGLRATRDVSIQHKFLIFLYIVKDGASNRSAQEHFQHSGETISRHFHTVLDTLVSLAPTTIIQPDGRNVPAEIVTNPKFFPYFRNAVGAIDGTHIRAHVDNSERDNFRDKNGEITQAACDFNMFFQYVLAGWEGSAHDGTVLDDALRTDLRVPYGKYFLADAGFALSDSFLVPYRGVRYHLRETAQAGSRPSDMKELFNLRHSQLRNVIERIFGVLKRRFKCLKTPMEYPYSTQVKLVVALCTLQNLIRRIGGEDECDREEAEARTREGRRGLPSNESNEEPHLDQRVAGGYISRTEAQRAKEHRDQIASDMWRDYVQYRQRRRA